MSVNSKMTAVADEVRTLAGVSDKLSLDSMATHISDSNKEIQDQTELIGLIAEALKDKAVSGGEVEVVLQNKTVTPTKATQNVVADSGYTGLGRVTVQAIPSEYIVPSGSVDITENGVHDVTAYASVNVDVSGSGDLDALIDRSITEISSNVKAVSPYAFYGCSNLITVDFPVATSIGSYAFHGCIHLTTANIPAVTSISGRAFTGCNSLTTVDFPVTTSIENYAFYNCGGLITVDFPVATRITNNAFYGCSNLITVDFPVATSIENSAFRNCYSLTALLLRNSSRIATLSSTGAFNGCFHFHGQTSGTYNPQGLKDGYIYVPRALLSDEDATKDYRRATNWSTYASQFRAIEDYPDICGG